MEGRILKSTGDYLNANSSRPYQERYKPGISSADALILCTALGGGHSKIPDQCVGCAAYTQLLLFPHENYCTDFV